MTEQRILRGITWDHPRGIDPLRFLSDRYRTIEPDIQIEWTARPLRSFEDVALAELVAGHDLIAFDHPFIGAAVRDGVLLPLDGLVDGEKLTDRASDVMGPSNESYRREGRQWALAFDAASMVAATRPDLLGASAPSTWSDTRELARELGRSRVLLAANPTHLWGTALSLCHALAASEKPDSHTACSPTVEPRWWTRDGIAPDLLSEGIQQARDLVELCAVESLGSDPVDVLDRMSQTDEIVLSPLVFAYVTYARSGAMHRVRFSAAPSFTASPVGTLTGGVGLGVVRDSPLTDAAVDFALFATARGSQRDAAVVAGGQPARRSSWEDAEANLRTDGFFEACAPTMARSFLRPRGPGYPRFQRLGAEALHEGILRGEATSRIARDIAELWTDDAV